MGQERHTQGCKGPCLLPHGACMHRGAASLPLALPPLHDCFLPEPRLEPSFPGQLQALRTVAEYIQPPDLLLCPV
jgi:hypothetical protein